MSEHEFEAVFFGGNAPLPDDQGYIRRVPMARSPSTYEYFIPEEIETQQVYFDGTPPRTTGRYIRRHDAIAEERPIYLWERLS